MEKSKTKKKKRLAPTIVLIFVLISSVLILMELAKNVSVEIQSQGGGNIVVPTSEPTKYVAPTRSPDYTAEPIIDA